MSAIEFLLEVRKATYSELAKQLRLTEASTDNLVRDLVNLGHASTNRKLRTCEALFASQEEAFTYAQMFWHGHEVMRQLRQDVSIGEAFEVGRFEQAFAGTQRRSHFSEKTLKIYSNKVLRWLLIVGELESVDNLYRLPSDSKSLRPKQLDSQVSRRLRQGIFRGAAPAQVVIKAVSTQSLDGMSREQAEAVAGRNVINVLINLGVVQQVGPSIRCKQGLITEDLLRSAARRTATVKFAIDAMRTNPSISGTGLGRLISKNFGLEWSGASAVRNGNAIRSWALFALQKS